MAAKNTTKHVRVARNYDRDSFVIGAWLDDGADRIEALFVGKPGPDGLGFTGIVGFGLQGHRRQLRQLFDLIPAERSPFARRVGGRRVRWAQPRLLARVRFIGWDAGALREALFEGVQLA